MNTSERRRLLAYLGAAAIASGVPAHEVERDVRAVGAKLGNPKVQVHAEPGGIIVSLGDGDPATFETVEGALRLDQAAAQNELYTGLLNGRLSAEQALDELTTLRGKPHRSPVLGMYLGGLAVGIGLAFILQPSPSAVVFAAIATPFVIALMRLTGRGILPPVLLPLAATFLTGLGAFWAAEQGWLSSPLRTTLPAVAMLLPGATLVTGIAELVAGAMTAGIARLGHGATQLLMFTVGLLGAMNLLAVPGDQVNNTRADDFGAWSLAVGLVMVALGIALIEAVPTRFVPWVLLVLSLTLLTQLSLQQTLNAPWAGGFGGAFIASLLAWALALRGPKVPRLVLFLPSFWLLVPGSFGLVTVTQLSAAAGGRDLTIVAGLMLGIAVGMVLGTGTARVLHNLFAVRATRFSAE